MNRHWQLGRLRDPDPPVGEQPHATPRRRPPGDHDRSGPQSQPLSANSIPSAWVSFPGPEQSSRSGTGPRRSRISSTPSIGSSARINTPAAIRRFADGVQQRVDPIGAVHVGDPGPAEQQPVALRSAPRTNARPVLTGGRPRSRVTPAVSPLPRRSRSAPWRLRPRRARRTSAAAAGRSANCVASALQLLTHARQRGRALRQLALQPGAVGEQPVVLVVEQRRRGGQLVGVSSDSLAPRWTAVRTRAATTP